MRILSIDLDYIMGPSIAKYEDHFWNDNAGTRWETFFREHKPNVKESDLPFDKGHLFYLFKLFNKCLHNGTEVSFAYDHDNILYSIGDKTDLEIINIDHHHDVLYHGYGIHEPNLPDGTPSNKGNKHEFYHSKHNNDVDEGSWIAYLRTQDRVKSYTWITSQNAIDGVSELDMEYYKSLIPNMRVTTKEEYDILDYDFDHMHLCLSPQYIPPVHWHLYTLFLISYETYTGKKVDLGEIGNKKFEMSIRHLNVTNEILH